MLDFLPTWIKALIGTGVILFIAIQGFRLTSKSDKGGKSGKGSDDNK